MPQHARRGQTGVDETADRPHHEHRACHMKVRPVLEHQVERPVGTVLSYECHRGQHQTFVTPATVGCEAVQKTPGEVVRLGVQ